MDEFDYQFLGMHVYWWAFWVMLLVPFFIIARPVRRRTVRLYEDDPMGFLLRRYAAGEITTEEYVERKGHIERDSGYTRGPVSAATSDERGMP